MNSFAGLFKTRTCDGVDYAKLYVEGLVTAAPRKNMERMDEHLGAGMYQNVQQFISASPWDERPVYDKIAQRANRRLGDMPESCLGIDEVGHSKKGDKSVGVARQYNGRLGKQDNCQVGVHSALICGTRAAIIGSRLLLPQDWSSDLPRCLKAGVPLAEIKERSKLDLALELIDQAVEQGVQFACVVFDAFYGRDSQLRESIHQRGLIYCAEVPSDTNVFITEPTTPTRPKQIKQHTRSVSDLAAEMARSAKGKTTVRLREGENGIVQVEAWAQRIWVWPEGLPCREQWLLVRRMSDGELKTTLCNAGASTPIKRMVQWQASRFQIERAFQDAKSHLGMGQYQARGWLAWHHHMVLVAMALLFVMEQRLAQAEGALSMMSARDVVEMLDWCLTKPRSAEQVMTRLQARHAQRRRNAVTAQRRKRKELGLPRLRKSRRSKVTK